MSIVSETDLKTLLGLSSSITAEEEAVLDLVLPQAEACVRNHLRYDPEQQSHTEYYWFREIAGSVRDNYIWDVNTGHTRAVYERLSETPVSQLQLRNLPVRSITHLYVDSSAYFATVAGSFGSSTEWTEGEDFWPEYDASGICMSGILHASGSWPVSAGGVKVIYIAGYSAEELAGGVLTPDPLGIKRAVFLTAVKAFSTWMSNKKKTMAGWTAGPLASEKLGDYSYNAAGAGVLASMITALPAEAERELEPFVHWGAMSL